MTLQSEFEDIFLNDSFFYEDIVYYIGGATAKSIPAIITRNFRRQRAQLGDRGSQSKPVQYDVTIMISTGATDGIEVIMERVDTVDIPLNCGDAATARFHVQAIIKQDAGAVTLGLSK